MTTKSTKGAKATRATTSKKATDKKPAAKAKATSGKWSAKILGYLVKHPDCTREAICKALDTEHFSGALPRLFKAGLVSRKQLKDVRGSAYSITAAGVKALESKGE